MNRPFLTFLATGLSLIPAFALAETLPLPLTGPAYTVANEAYSAYERKDYDLAIAKAREALRLRADVKRLNTLIELAERDKSCATNLGPLHLARGASFTGFRRGVPGVQGLRPRTIRPGRAIGPQGHQPGPPTP
ncbi:hypothetical protein [Pseudomonas sp. H3_H05]